jgi:DNA polymerase-3 subunit alpha
MSQFQEQMMATLVTQYNMKELDSAGILKMDFLGLRTLTIIRDTIKQIKKTRNIDFDIESISVDDKKTYELFSKGQTTAVFQFESSPMKEYLKQLKPTSINDLAAMNALYRPGPMEFIDEFIDRKHGRKKIEYLHPLLEPILKETHGIIVYQEQVIQIANKIAGMSLAEADNLRRAMGKKDLAAMKKQKAKFTEGAVKNKISKKVAEEIYVVIDKFANYGFNKSHAVAYSIVAYQTAYLKAHYLEEFLAANLTNEFGNTDKVTKLLDDARKLKVEILPPSVNKPSVFFNVENGKIIFGMSAIKNVGVNAVEEIEKKRAELGRNFKCIYDFCSHVDTRIVNKRALEGLVKAGAFDCTKGKRSQNFEAIEHALNFGGKVQSSKSANTDSLFGSDHEDYQIKEPPLPKIPPWSEELKLAKEREVLGIYLTDHPLTNFEIEYRSFAQVHLGEPETFKENEQVRACGVITEIKTKMDRAGNQMAFFKLDDFSGSCECLMFSKIYAEYGKFIQSEKCILINGRLESSGDAVKLHVEDVMPLEESRTKLTKKIAIFVDENTCDVNKIINLKKIFNNQDGNIPVYLCVKNNGSHRSFYLDHKIDLKSDTLKEIAELLGQDSINYYAQ